MSMSRKIAQTTGRRRSVGRTQVQVKIFGEAATQEYTFPVDTGATYLGLPLEEIEALGLQHLRVESS